MIGYLSQDEIVDDSDFCPDCGAHFDECECDCDLDDDDEDDLEDEDE